MATSAMMARAWTWLRRRWIIVAATVFGGALVVASKVWSAVGWGSVALEIGAGLLLVAVVYKLEERLREDTSEQIDAIRGEVEDVGTRVDDLADRVNTAATAAFVEAVDLEHDRMFDGFVSEPSIDALLPIFSELREHQLPQAVALFPTDECMLNVSYDGEVLQVKIMPNGAKGKATQQVVKWLPEESYGDFIKGLGQKWGKSGLYPGHESFQNFNFAHELARSLRQQLDQPYGR